MTDDEYDALWAKKINLNDLGFRVKTAALNTSDKEVEPILEEIVVVLSRFIDEVRKPGTVKDRKDRVFDLFNLNEELEDIESQVGEIIVEYVRTRMRELELKAPNDLIFDEIANRFDHLSQKMGRKYWGKYKNISGSLYVHSPRLSKSEALLELLRKTIEKKPLRTAETKKPSQN